MRVIFTRLFVRFFRLVFVLVIVNSLPNLCLTIKIRFSNNHHFLFSFLQYDGSLERLAKESDLLRSAYGHFFDLTIVNNDIGETIATLENAIDKVHSTAQWVPVSWLY
jgi:hypothetical protein